MQRRNVDLPDPDGPRMHMTSPRCTCRSMPFSTSSGPKFLHTASALTIGTPSRTGFTLMPVLASLRAGTRQLAHNAA